MFEVVVAGGGVASLEAILALRELAGERVSLTVVTPSREFAYRPVAVLEPFLGASPRSLDLAAFADETHTTLVRDRLVAVDRDHRIAHTAGGRELGYDALLIAVGAGTSEVVPGAIVLDPDHVGDSLAELIGEIDAGAIRSIAFVIARPAWPLAAYELSMMFSQRARELSLSLSISIVTAEQRPLASFGRTVSIEVAKLLADSGVTVMAGSRVARTDTGLLINPGQRTLDCDRVIAVPRLAGPRIAGLPSDPAGFIPVRPAGHVPGIDRVWAAGDATNFAIKWGGFAAQQADAAASSIATLAGADAPAAPFRGEVRGVLFAGIDGRQLHFAVRIADGIATDSQVSDAPLAAEQTKIAARHLSPYLEAHWGGGPRWLAGHVSWDGAAGRLAQKRSTG
jgi:sulfide:quinone oxidoreductase